jgi:hypothetical protein
MVCAALSAGLTVALAAVALAAVPPAAAQTVVGDRRPELVASYEIRARLDAGEHRIDGSETIHWRNPSRRPATELCFHLYLNAFRNSASTWLRHEGAEQIAVLEPDGWGWIELVRLEAGGSDLLDRLEIVAPDDGNPEDATVARVRLPRPVGPGETLDVQAGFLAQLPRAVARTGYRRDYHLAAQWFPKLGVLEPDGTWSCHQFHRSSEFYADFGDYDVSLTVPERFVVGATGEQVSTADNGDGTVTRRFVQQAVHDFAWTAWPRFVERQRTFRHPGLPEVEITLLLRPDTRHLEQRYFTATEQALRLFGTWFGPYPYTTLTVVDPAWGAEATDGMEYPTFILAGSRIFDPRAIQVPESVTVHEFGHQYFYGLLASDEVSESYLDEGINTWASYRALDAAYGPKLWSWRLWGVPVTPGDVAMEFPHDAAARYFRRPSTDPIARTSYGYLDRPAYRAQTYSKMAIAMGQLERMLGTEAMERGMRRYTTAWRFRHPKTADFERAMSRGSGRDLSRFFRQVIHGSEVLDYAVTVASTRRREGPIGVFGRGRERQTTTEAEPLPGWESEVVVERLGGVRLPVEVELAFADGQRRRLVWQGEERWVRYRIRGPRLEWAVADPDETLLLDVDRLNNSRATEPDRTASRRWGQRARFWIQNLLATFAGLA